ncbi:MAG: hypothetical protein ACBZ72_03990 [Candidatus Bathyarchaeia archaeon]
MNRLNALAKCLRVAVLVGLLFSGLLMAASAIGFAAAADAPATQWSQTYGGTDWDYAECVVQTSDGGYALAGYTASFGAGYSDFWLVKTDASGTLQWSQNYGGPGSEWAYCVVQTSDGGYALAGRTASFGAGFDFWLVKTDASGTLQWSQNYGGPGSEWAYCVVQTSDGGYALAGRTASFGAGFDFWLVKTDASGTLQWSQNYGGPGSEWAYCVVQTSDGGYALAGRTASFGAGSNDFWLVKTAPDSLFVVPESAFGALGTIVACITAMAIIATNKKRQTK